MRISNSFSEGEIQVLDFIMQTLLRGGTPHMVTRHKEFASVCRKVLAMKQKVHEKEQRDLERKESSVGVVGAPDASDHGAEQAVEQAGEDLATAV